MFYVESISRFLAVISYILVMSVRLSIGKHLPQYKTKR